MLKQTAIHVFLLRVSHRLNLPAGRRVGAWFYSVIPGC